MDSKRIRDEARFQVFAHMSKAILAYILSGIITTVVVYNLQISAFSRNISLVSDNPKVVLITFFAMTAGLILNLPLSFCAQRFFLVLSTHTPMEPIPLKRFFEPFEKPKLLLKGALLVLLTSILSVLGIFVLIFPVWLAFSAAVFFLSENPEISVFEALKRSAKMMKGRKMFAFKTLLPLFLIYIGISVFLGSLYLVSFFAQTVTEIMIWVVLAIIYNENKKAVV